MFNRHFNKSVSILLIFIFLFGLIPGAIFAQPSASMSTDVNVQGFNKSAFDSHFSRADREINPDRWFYEAQLGISQVIFSWELYAISLYDNPLLFEEARNQLIKWSEEELEKRFSQWLAKRFFGEAAENALTAFSSELTETQKKYSYYLDDNGNILFDSQTGDPLIIRPDDKEFSQDIILWRQNTAEIIAQSSKSLSIVLTSQYTELLAYIPEESRDSMSRIINETIVNVQNKIKTEFENIAAREERILTSTRTRDIWSLRRQSENESASIFTQNLIAETELICSQGIDRLNAQIEAAYAGTGDLALYGEEWLRLYQEQFDRGLKAWEEAEERFFIRRIEWEQDAVLQEQEGLEIWQDAFNQLTEKQKEWELQAKSLYEDGVAVFAKISEEFEKNLENARKEFEANMNMRIGEGKTRVTALIDMYLICSSAAFSLKDNFIYYRNQFNSLNYSYNNIFATFDEFIKWFEEIRNDNLSGLNYKINIKLNQIIEINDDDKEKNKDEDNSISFISGKETEGKYLLELSGTIQKIINENLSFEEEYELLKDINYSYLNNSTYTYFSSYLTKDKYSNLYEIYNYCNSYFSYLDKANDARNRIMENFSDLMGSGALKDILSPDAKSEDFFLDEYQLSLIKAKALVAYWEQKTDIAQAVADYAQELSAGRMTQTESLLAWEASKEAYNESLKKYETELDKLTEIGESIQNQQTILDDLALEMQKAENKLNELYEEYSTILAIKAINRSSFYLKNVQDNYNLLIQNYNSFLNTGDQALYKTAIEYGIKSEEIENWDQTYENLTELFITYGTDTNLSIESMQIICNTIRNQDGDFVQNVSLFLFNFDNCFDYPPQWLEFETSLWKDSFIDYIASYALINNITINSDLLLIKENELKEKNVAFSEILAYLNSLDEDELSEINLDEINDIFLILIADNTMFNYSMQFYDIWEYLSEKSGNNDKHWREFITVDYISEYIPDYFPAGTKNEGLFLDMQYDLTFFTNRINYLFKTINEGNIFYNKEDTRNYFDLYYNEAATLNMMLNTIKNIFEEISFNGKSYDISRLNYREIDSMLETAYKDYKKQEEDLDKLRDEYFEEVNKFMQIGSKYDAQYNVLKKAYEDSDKKCFEYEKQDAIQRWASTSYLGIDLNNLEECKTKLIRAQAVLDVLSGIYNDETNRPYISAEYRILYNEYAASFQKRLKTSEVIVLYRNSLGEERYFNESIYNSYCYSVINFGNAYNSFYNHITSDNDGSWQVYNTITVNNGKLTFKNTYNDQIPPNTLEDFFKNDYFDSVRELSIRMNDYFASKSVSHEDWSYARDYILLLLINKDDQFKEVLEKYYIGCAEMTSGGEAGKLLVKTSSLGSTKSVFSEIKNNPLIASRTAILKESWDKLDANQKEDLLFYTILTLTDNINDDFYGFGLRYTYNVYKLGYEEADYNYRYAKRQSDNVGFLSDWNYKEMRDINSNTRDKLETAKDEFNEKYTYWASILGSSCNSINYFYEEYLASCKRLKALEGEKEEGYIEWSDLESALLQLNNYTYNEILYLKSIWETMRLTDKYNYKTLLEAFNAMNYWAVLSENNAEKNLNDYWEKEIKNQEEKEKTLFEIAEDYISGKTNLNALNKAALNTYNTKSASEKNHLSNMQNAILNNMSLYPNVKIDLSSDFASLTDKLAKLTEESLKTRYEAELAAREVEWNQKTQGIIDKQNEWLVTAGQIFENGRNEWAAGLQRMQNAFYEWHKNFRDEYDRVSDEWDIAYLAGLEDKETWLRMAEAAADQASAEAFLSLIGTEGERLSRKIDTREPFGIRVTAPDAKAMMTELLESAGIANMQSAFTSLNNIGNVSSVIVMGNIGGYSIWDAKSVQIAASDLARQRNKEIAEEEIRKLAQKAKADADIAVQNLKTAVTDANKNVRSNLDYKFITEGFWRNKGNYYEKEIITGSTLFTPVIKETATIEVYRDFVMETIQLETNLDESYLISLNSIAIRGLLENAYLEIQTYYTQIFGNGSEYSKGTFGIHVGTAPDPNDKSDKGEGEQGRIFSEYYYWYKKDAEGLSQLQLAPWDKKMWDDSGNWFKAPTLRFVNEIACIVASAVVSVVTFGAGTPLTVAMIAATVAINTADDLLFATLDVGAGYKSFNQASFDLGKTIAINTASSVIGGAFSGISINGVTKGLTSTVTSSLSNSIGSTAGTVIGNTVMTGLQTAVTGTVTSALGAVTLDGNKLDWSKSAFESGMKSMGQNALVSMTSTAVSSSLTVTNAGEKLFGYNNEQISDIYNLNGLVGSLAGQGVNLALGNDFTLNLFNLNFLEDGLTGTGLLEMHLGRNGFSMNLGTGGADVSINNLASVYSGIKVLNVNSKIKGYVNNDENEFKSAIALRSQYGFGDDRQVEQLWDILKGDTILEVGGDDFTAETTINENGQRVVTMGYNEGMSPEEQMRLGVILGHEAYRDGYVTDNNYLETRDATMAHTEMAIRMISDGHYGILNDNLLKDIAAYNQGIDFFNAYVDANYDSSADYWKLMRDGTLVNDNSGWLTYEDGRPVLNADGKQIGADGIETGLLNILYGGTSGVSYDNYNDAQVGLAQALMYNAGMRFTNAENGEVRSRLWSGNTTGQSLNMNFVMLYAGATVAAPVFANYYESTAIKILAESQGKKISDITTKKLTAISEPRFYVSFLPEVEGYYNSMRHFFDESAGFSVSAEHGATDSKYKYKYYVNDAHFGTDFSNQKSGDSIYLGISGIVTYTGAEIKPGEGNGNWMIVQYGYNFEGSFIGSGIYGEYMHMESKPDFKNNTYLNSNQIIGTVGNTGNSDGAHLHYSIYTLPNNPYSQSSLKMILNNNIANTVIRKDGTKVTYNIENYLKGL